MCDIQAIAEREGYIGVRQCENGVWIGVMPQIYTFRLCIGLNEYGYERGYCYERLTHALIAAAVYEGEGDPSGSWIKMKGESGEKLGPGARPGVIVDE